MAGYIYKEDYTTVYPESVTFKVLKFKLVLRYFRAQRDHIYNHQVYRIFSYRYSTSTVLLNNKIHLQEPN